MSTRSYLDELGDDLDAAFDRLVDERRRRKGIAYRAAAVAAAVVVVAAAVVVADSGKPAAAGVSVQHRNGQIIVRLTDIEYRPEVIEHATAAAGLDVDVTAVATGPSLVGRFLRAEAGAGDEVKQIGRDGPSFTGFAVQEGWGGRLEIYVGRPADGGEPYETFPNAVSEGEPLACTGILGSRADAASTLIADRDLDVRWRAVATTGERDLRVSELDESPWNELVVTRAEALDRSHVLIVLAAPGSAPADRLLTKPADC